MKKSITVALFVLLSCAISAQCPTSTSCDSGVIGLTYSALPNSGNVDSIEFKFGSTKYGVAVDSIIGNTIYLTRPSGMSPTDSVNRITYYYQNAIKPPKCYDAIAVPVTWLEFGYMNFKGIDYLYWATASEYNNALFVVEKAEEDLKFDSILSLSGNGTSYGSNHYTTAVPIDNEITFFRVKQVDYNGDYSYSKTIVVHKDVKKLEVIGVFDILGRVTEAKDGIMIYRYSDGTHSKQAHLRK